MTKNAGSSAHKKPRTVIVQDPEEIYMAMQASFQDFEEDGEAFLDLETGDVIYLHVKEDWEDDDIDAAMERGEIDEEEKTLAKEIYEDPAKRERYLPISEGESWWGYQDLKDFIETETIDNPGLFNRLTLAIQGKGAFGRFKEVLAQAGGTWLDQWYTFEADRHESRVREWLIDNDVEMKVNRERLNHK